ncbi:MAG: arylsulfatase [Planctomycetota bacterium]
MDSSGWWEAIVITHVGVRFLGSILSLALTLSAAHANEGSIKRPNIIVILADDLGYGDIGAYNQSSKISTPHLDRLAADGIRFTDAHSPSAVCTPTRYGLLTGRYCWRSRLKKGVLSGTSPNLIEPGRWTLATAARANGYATIAIGKWHLGLGLAEETDYEQPLHPGPLDHGFGEFFGIPASLDMEPYLWIRDDRPVAFPGMQTAASQRRKAGGGGFWRGGRIAPGFTHEGVLPRLLEESVAFIERQARLEPERPFFLYLPLASPHTPWMPSEIFRGTSEAGYYGDFTHQVDASVGALLGALERTGRAEETLVVFTSDNGSHWGQDDIEEWGHLSNGPWRGQKADIWEAGHRIPFLVRWPGHIEGGRVSDETITLCDLMATFTDIWRTNLPENAGEDSASLLPIFQGDDLDQPLHEAVVHHSADGMFAIRRGPWKYVEGRGSGGFTTPRRVDRNEEGGPFGQLYQLDDDPGETTNLYDEQPEVVQELSELLQRYKRQGHSRGE